MEFPQQNQEKPEPVKRPRGRPPVKAQFLPDSARDSVQIVKSEYIKKDDNGIPKKIMTVAESKALQGDKKPLSEAQKANLKRMLELNKARRDATKTQEIPEEVPEGYDAIYVPPKKNTALSSQARELMQPKPQPPQPQSSIPPEWLEMMRQMNDRMNMLTTQYSKTKESKAKLRPPKKPSRRREDTSDTQDTETETETGYDTSDTEYVKKYEKKAARRMEAVKEIEAKLQKKVNPPPPPKPRTKYDGLSIF